MIKKKSLLLSGIFLCSTINPVAASDTSESSSSTRWLKTAFCTVGGTIGLIAAYNGWRNLREKHIADQYENCRDLALQHGLLAQDLKQGYVITDKGNTYPTFVAEYNDLKSRQVATSVNQHNRALLRKVRFTRCNQSVDVLAVNDQGKVAVVERTFFWPWGRSFY